MSNKRGRDFSGDEPPHKFKKELEILLNAKDANGNYLIDLMGSGVIRQIILSCNANDIEALVLTSKRIRDEYKANENRLWEIIFKADFLKYINQERDSEEVQENLLSTFGPTYKELYNSLLPSFVASYHNGSGLRGLIIGPEKLLDTYMNSMQDLFPSLYYMILIIKARHVPIPNFETKSNLKTIRNAITATKNKIAQIKETKGWKFERDLEDAEDDKVIWETSLAYGTYRKKCSNSILISFDSDCEFVKKFVRSSTNTNYEGHPLIKKSDGFNGIQVDCMITNNTISPLLLELHGMNVFATSYASLRNPFNRYFDVNRLYYISDRTNAYDAVTIVRLFDGSCDERVIFEEENVKERNECYKNLFKDMIINLWFYNGSTRERYSKKAKEIIGKRPKSEENNKTYFSNNRLSLEKDFFDESSSIKVKVVPCKNLGYVTDQHEVLAFPRVKNVRIPCLMYKIKSNGTLSKKPIGFTRVLMREDTFPEMHFMEMGISQDQVLNLPLNEKLFSDLKEINERLYILDPKNNPKPIVKSIAKISEGTSSNDITIEKVASEDKDYYVLYDNKNNKTHCSHAHTNYESLINHIANNKTLKNLCPKC
jgi:hypothetical protein